MTCPFKTAFIMIERPAAVGETELRARLKLLGELGYDGAELQLTDPPGVDLDRLARWLEEEKLALPSFMTGEAYADGLCLSSPDPDIRRRTVQRLASYLPIAKRFGALLVVGLLQGLRRDEPDPVVAGARIADGLKALGEAAERAGVDIVIEPVNHLQVGFHNSVREVTDLIARIGSPAIRPMVDTVHMNIEEAPLTEPIHACGKALRHVHLCESHGGRFGTGRIDFPAVLAALKQTGYAGFTSVKVYRNLPFAEAARSSMAYLRSIA